MIQRFLEYSLRYGKPVKVMWITDAQILSRNLTVTRVGEEDFDYVSTQNKKSPRTMLKSDVLSCSYARGDDGDTLK
ncbi:MAG: hypothetical protein PHQ85_08740 [Eubacteriales bacterium]|nr:hypothetical protein [Eubacteriales bacterium]MDD4106039.1 hypothetical protein [Eubacteriales bacterium]MDD4711342.1 hypothetical protein [Eubacteriales bacterium]NLO16356.1 hypothetical protein [Clostridiales bacterium]